MKPFIRINEVVGMVLLILVLMNTAWAQSREVTFASNRETGRLQIWRVQTNPLGTPQQVTTAGAGNQESRAPDWSATQRRIAYQFGASGVRGIHMINPDGTSDVRLTTSPADEREPSWSPDGQFIVYSHQPQGASNYDLWIHKVGDPTTTADDEDYRLLLLTPSQEMRPSWSPDGNSIAFTISGGSFGSDFEIAVQGVQVVGGRVQIVPGTFRLLTDNTFIDFDPAWSPDSQQIAYSTTRNGGRDIYRMSATSGESNQVRLTTHPGNDTNPAWSPDGTTITFVSDRDGNKEIYLMSATQGEADITNFVRVTTDPADDDDPSFLIMSTESAADLSITQSASPNPVASGSNLTYAITVFNNGPDAATSVTVTDNLPAETTFVSCSSTGGGVCGGSGSNRTVTFASLANGASATITIVARVNDSVPSGTVISNTATVSSSTPDPDLSNNSATQVVTVSGMATPEISVVPREIALHYSQECSDLVQLAITNTGGDGSVLNGTILPPQDPFAIVSGGGEFSLGRGESRYANVSFTPTMPTGIVGGRIDIHSNDPNNPTLTIPLTGFIYDKRSLENGRFGYFYYRDHPTAGDPDAIEVDPCWVRENIVYVDLTGLGTWPVHRLAAPNFRAAFERISEDPSLMKLLYRDPGDYTYVPRYQRGYGSTGDPRYLSNHSWGTAIDINNQHFPQGTPAAPGSENHVLWIRVFSSFGFRWGNDFEPPDPMHYEVIP